MLAFLDLDFAMLCAPCRLACVVISIPPKVCLDVGVLGLHLLHSVRCWYACLACFAPLIWLSLLLCIFARLPTCSCISLCVVHILIQWNYEHLIQTYICPPRSLSLFDNMFVCPCLASFPGFSLACFSFHLFLCLFAGLFLLSLHIHVWSEDTWSKGATS